MAHKTLIGGTAYEISGGKALVNGTGYEIKNGKTLVGGTAYEIGFAPKIVKIRLEGWSETRDITAWCTINGVTYDNVFAAQEDVIELEVLSGTVIHCSVKMIPSYASGLHSASIDFIDRTTVPYKQTTLAEGDGATYDYIVPNTNRTLFINIIGYGDIDYNDIDYLYGCIEIGL